VLLPTKKSVAAKRGSQALERRVHGLSQTYVACLVLCSAICLTLPLFTQGSSGSKKDRPAPGKLLLRALPDDLRSDDSLRLEIGAVPVVHTIWRIQRFEDVTIPPVTPIPSVLFVRPPSDRAPPFA